MIKGTVKFYNQGKGFGFITPDDGGADVFVPATTLSASNVSSLKAGQRVRFEIQPDKKGAKAGRLVIDAVNPPEEQPTRPTATVHYDPSSEESMDVLATLNALGEKFLSVIMWRVRPAKTNCSGYPFSCATVAKAWYADTIRYFWGFNSMTVSLGKTSFGPR